MWRVPTQNLVKGKPGAKKKAAAKPACCAKHRVSVEQEAEAGQGI